MKTPPLVLCGLFLMSASLLASATTRSAEPTPAGVGTPKKSAKAAAGKTGGKVTQRKRVGGETAAKATPAQPALLFGPSFPALNLSTQLQPQVRQSPSPVEPAPATLPTPFLQPTPFLAYAPSQSEAAGKPLAAARNPAASQANLPALASPRPRYQVVPPPRPVPGGPNPYLTPQRVNDPFREWGEVFADLGFGPQSAKTAAAKAAGQGPKLAMPSLPSLPPLLPEGLAVLPVIKTVYPTGEKPLVIVTFKCPTELIGITPLPTKALHDIVTWGMDGINSTNLLSFNMQQVCQ